MVVEADESDGTFTRLPSTYVVVTNIDKEHLDFMVMKIIYIELSCIS